MCLTESAFALFLNIVAGAEVTTEPDRITVHGTAKETVWVQSGGDWCIYDENARPLPWGGRD